jgi:hypothetical protein
MRPWFTFVGICLVILGIIGLLFVVNFVLVNQDMFKATYNITVPYLKSEPWIAVPFIHIMAGSVLLGALIVAIITLGFDAKRTLKINSMKKQLKQLQEDLRKAQAQKEAQEFEAKRPDLETQIAQNATKFSPESADVAPITPEDITKSFEDAVDKKDFLGDVPKEFEDKTIPTNVEKTDPQVTTAEIERQSNDRESEPAATQEYPFLRKEAEFEQEAPVEATVVERETAILTEENPEKKDTEKQANEAKIL